MITNKSVYIMCRCVLCYKNDIVNFCEPPQWHKAYELIVQSQKLMYKSTFPFSILYMIKNNDK